MPWRELKRLREWRGVKSSPFANPDEADIYASRGSVIERTLFWVLFAAVVALLIGTFLLARF